MPWSGCFSAHTEANSDELREGCSVNIEDDAARNAGSRVCHIGAAHQPDLTSPGLVLGGSYEAGGQILQRDSSASSDTACWSLPLGSAHNVGGRSERPPPGSSCSGSTVKISPPPSSHGRTELHIFSSRRRRRRQKKIARAVMVVTIETATPAAIAAALILFLGTGDSVPVELAPSEKADDPAELVETPTVEDLSV